MPHLFTEVYTFSHRLIILHNLLFFYKQLALFHLFHFCFLNHGFLITNHTTGPLYNAHSSKLDSHKSEEKLVLISTVSKTVYTSSKFFCPMELDAHYHIIIVAVVADDNTGVHVLFFWGWWWRNGGGQCHHHGHYKMDISSCFP